MTHDEQRQADIEAEQRAVALFTSWVRENRVALRPIAHWGDGQCGHLRDILHLELFGEPIKTFRRDPRPRLDGRMRKLVYERDAYRCKRCGGYVDLTVDHIIPVSCGGKTALDNLQTLCRPCNSRKGKRHE